MTLDNTEHRPARDSPLAGAITEPGRDAAPRKTPIRLADGRELIYFDEPGRPPRTARDRRELGPAESASELRLDPLTDEWIIIASHRQERTHLPPSDACPLCPSSPGKLTEIPENDYDVVVFENRFPSLGPVPANRAALTSPTCSLLEHRAGAGRCEVVCFSADHEASFAKLAPARVRTIMDAWADRHLALSALPGVRQVFPFENRGREVGVTLSHPHGQIYAYPFVTPRTRQMLETAGRYYDRTGRNLFADVLRAEVDAGERIVGQSQHWTAFIPSAARWPVEVHLYPNRAACVLSDLTSAERDDFAEIYLHVLHQIDSLYGVPLPYIAAWYQAPTDTPPQHSYLHLRFTSPRRAADKLKFLAGSESAMGVYVNDVAPEQIARPAPDVDMNLGRDTPKPVLVDDVCHEFARTYGQPPQAIWRAPGRVNIIGEHTDYNEGFVLPMALSEGVTVCGARRRDNRLVLSSRRGGSTVVDLDDLAPGSVAGWPAYAAGVAWALRQAGYVTHGASIAIDSDLTAGVGLSSSAALECAVALTELSGATVPRTELARIARQAENDFVGVPTGIMDQFAALLCRAGHALLIDCRTECAAPVPLDFASAGRCLVIIDTRVRHALADGRYAERHRECLAAARALGVRSLRDVPGEEQLADIPSDKIRRRARHVIEENCRVLQAAQVLQDGRLAAIGSLMTASHASLRDDFHVSWPQADAAVDAALSAGADGARMTGGGFGGSVIALVPVALSQSVAASVRRRFSENEWQEPTVTSAVPSDGARSLR